MSSDKCDGWHKEIAEKGMEKTESRRSSSTGEEEAAKSV